MTTTFLSKPQQTALQEALVTNKLLSNNSLTSCSSSTEQQAYSHIAVTLYRFNLQKIKWPYFLNTAINTATDVCQWLTCELVRCQQEYQAQPNENAVIEQSAFFNGIFSEELTYINTIVEANTHAE